MITKKGWASELMLSLFKKEATYGAGVTMTDANACSMKGYSAEVSWPDKVESDKDEITGTEQGTDQEIIQQGVKIAYKEAKAKPNSVIGLGALAMGAITSTQDAALTAYSHKVTRVALGTAIPSIQAEAKVGGLHYAYKGIKCNRWKISGDAGGMISLEADLVGSGKRDVSTTAFAAKITESWLKVRDCKVWMESGTAISIGASLVQGAEDISSGTPRVLGVRMKTFSLEWDNKGEGQPGFGGDGNDQDYDYGRRACSLSLSLLYNDATEVADFLAQNPLAIEFDLKGALIAATGTMYYGIQAIVPKFKLKSAPLPKGGAGDILTCDLETEIFDDGTNAPIILEGYNAKTAYLVAA